MVERRTVAPDVAGSIPVTHPISSLQWQPGQVISMGLVPSQAPHNPGSKISIQEATVKRPTILVRSAVIAVAPLASTIVNCNLATHPPANGSLT